MLHIFGHMDALSQIYNLTERPDFTEYNCIRLIDCQINSWVLPLVGEPTGRAKLIICYDWQEGLVRDLFSKMAERVTVWVMPMVTDNICEYLHMGNGEGVWKKAYKLES